MAQTINIAVKQTGDSLTAGELNSLVAGTNAAITEQNETKSAHAAAIANKVDKVTGKGLSTEDYTTAEKQKLANVAENANNYTHPDTHPLSMITETDTLKVMTAAERTKLAGIPDNYTYSPSVKLDNAINVMKSFGNKIIVGGEITGGLAIIEDYDVNRTIFNVSGINDIAVFTYNDELAGLLAVGDFHSIFSYTPNYKALYYPIEAIDNSVYAIKIINGQIYISGSFTGFFRKIQPATQASFDNTYTPYLPANTINVTVFCDQGTKMLLVGQTYENSNTAQFFIRLNSDGSADSTFTPPTIDGDILTISIESTQKIIIAGKFTGGVMRLNADGSADSTFTSPPLVDYRSEVRNVNYIDSRYLIGGYLLDEDAHGLIMLNADGSVDSSFTPPPLFDYVNPVALIEDFIAVFDYSSNTVMYYQKDGSLAQIEQSAFDELKKKIQMLDKITIQ